MSNKVDFSIFNKVKKYKISVENIDEIVDKDFVKSLRKKLNLTQNALAMALGVTKKTIEKWEQGKNPIKGCSARLLFSLEKNPELLKQFYNVEIVNSDYEYKLTDEKVKSNLVTIDLSSIIFTKNTTNFKLTSKNLSFDNCQIMRG